MKKELLKNEIRKMLQFHRSVLLWLLKGVVGAIRYGLWLLPWILFATFLWKPMFEGWRLFTQDGVPSGTMQRVAGSVLPYGGVTSERAPLGWEAIPGKVDASVRTVERISRQVRRR